MKKMNYALACGALMLSASAYAQEATRTIEFSGDVIGFYDALWETGVDNYRVTLEVNESAVPVSQSATQISYGPEYIVSTKLEYFDAEGMEVLFDGGFTVSGPSQYGNLTYYREASSNEYVLFYFEGIEGNVSIYFYGPHGSLFSSFSASPTFHEAPEQASISSHFYALVDGGQGSYYHDDPNGTLLSVGASIADSDGDGVADDVDVCTSSNLDETVAFGGWYETGVTNYMDESGCSIMDHYAACEAESESTAPAGPVFSSFAGPSYCETSVGYSLQGEGVIDYTESRMLRKALYNYQRSGGNG